MPNGNTTVNTNTSEMNVNSQTQQNNSGPNTPNSQVEAADEEPLYVNAKQYHRILKRRQARNRLENEGRIPKNRQVYNFTLVLKSKQK